MRNISFSLTTEQFVDQTKTVTRRLGWKDLRPGDVLMGCKKCMGLMPGEKIERLALIRVLADEEYGREECKKEGFPNLSPAEFVAMFCKKMKCKQNEDLTRIEFEYL